MYPDSAPLFFFFSRTRPLFFYLFIALIYTATRSRRVRLRERAAGSKRGASPDKYMKILSRESPCRHERSSNSHRSVGESSFVSSSNASWTRSMSVH